MLAGSGAKQLEGCDGMYNPVTDKRLAVDLQFDRQTE